MLVKVRRQVVAALLVLALTGAGCGDGGGGGERVDAPWFVVGTRRADVLILDVGIGSSSCNDLHGFEAIESEDSVEIHAYVTVDEGGDCTADYDVLTIDLQLDDPLGQRRIVGCRPEGPLTAGFARPTGAADAGHCIGM